MLEFWEWMLHLLNADIYGTIINKLFIIILSYALVNYDYKIDTIFGNECNHHEYALFFEDSFLQ